MTYRLGVDVGGTFTDVLLVEESSGATWRAKTASTPSDQAVGVLNGIAKVCDEAGIALSEVAQVLHGTTVATNAILEGKGATVGLVTTKGFRQVLQIARSYVPGGLAGWIIWPKPEPLAALENTVEVDERIATDGTVIRELDDADVRAQLAKLDGVDALAVSLINSFADPAHERRIAEIAAEVLPDVPVSLSSDVLPEMREYERTVTTVANGYVQPQVKRYVETLAARLREGGMTGELAILRSDGGLSAAETAIAAPVTMLLSGPAGGVTGAVWIAEQCGYRDLITFDMGGTSTDVALVQDLTPADRPRDQGRRPHRARVQRRRTHGRCGWRLDRARPRADPGAAGRPAVRGRRPRPGGVRQGRRGADRDRRQRRARLPARGRSRAARSRSTSTPPGPRWQTIADAMGLDSPEAAAAGIVDIVNENMLGGLRLVSVQQGFDPRDFALVAFGGAGPAARQRAGRADRCVAGDRAAVAGGAVRARRRDHSLRARVGPHGAAPLRRLSRPELAILDELAAEASRALTEQGLPRRAADHGVPGGRALPRAGLRDPDRGASDAGPRRRSPTRFDAEHERLFSFLLTVDHELVNARATVTGPQPEVAPSPWRTGRRSPEAGLDTHPIYVEGHGGRHVYDRARCAPATWSPVRRSSPRWTRPPSSCPATRPPCTRPGAC